MIGAPWATIDLAALRNNVAVVRRHAPDAHIMAVVKANAYGHGVSDVVAALTDVDALAVARIDEALALRQRGAEQPIVILEGVFTTDDVALAHKNQLDLVIHGREQLALLADAHPTVPPRLWIKVDTGMHRLGFNAGEVCEAVRRVRQISGTGTVVGLMSHLADAEAPDSADTIRQISDFRELTRSHDGPASLANSAGVLCWPDARFDWVRPGIMLYGASPRGPDHADKLGLQPVMRFQTTLVATREISRGEGVGYGFSWRAYRRTRIGVAAAGYADGYPRHVPSGTPVLVGDRHVPIVGRVSMDLMTVDLGPDGPEKLGDVVTLWGDEALRVETIADHAGTISYELLSRVTQRVKLIPVGGD
ncbi:MAG: alanine racemase [Pseudomonadota bacterium]|nr:alanine racemase [Pseudomonadota bacterium]